MGQVPGQAAHTLQGAGYGVRELTPLQHRLGRALMDQQLVKHRVLGHVSDQHQGGAFGAFDAVRYIGKGHIQVPGLHGPMLAAHSHLGLAFRQEQHLHMGVKPDGTGLQILPPGHIDGGIPVFVFGEHGPTSFCKTVAIF